MDVNGAYGRLDLNLQNKTNSGNRIDKAPLPFVLIQPQKILQSIEVVITIFVVCSKTAYRRIFSPVQPTPRWCPYLTITWRPSTRRSKWHSKRRPKNRLSSTPSSPPTSCEQLISSSSLMVSPSPVASRTNWEASGSGSISGIPARKDPQVSSTFSSVNSRMAFLGSTTGFDIKRKKPKETSIFWVTPGSLLLAR